VSKSVLNFDPYFQKMNTFLGGPWKWLTFGKWPFLGYGVIWEIWLVFSPLNYTLLKEGFSAGGGSGRVSGPGPGFWGQFLGS
jgi:hypothetical protein